MAIIDHQTILITGGGGYLGSRLAGFLLGYNYRIILADIAFGKYSRQLAEEHPAVELVKLDLSDASSVKSALQGLQPGLVFHFAALLDRSRDFSIYPELYKVNAGGTLNLLEALKDKPYTKFCYAGSSEVYGSINPVPFSEEMPVSPASPYSLTKYMGEQLIRTWSAIHNKAWLNFRIFNFYGPGMPENTFIPQVISALNKGEPLVMSKGEQKRDFLYIDDLLWYIADLAMNEACVNQTVNICSGESVEISQIPLILNALSGGKLKVDPSLPYRENEIWDLKGSTRKLDSLCGPRDLVDLDTGLAMCLTGI